jgi:small-conductance mechanosensitive channel
MFWHDLLNQFYLCLNAEYIVLVTWKSIVLPLVQEWNRDVITMFTRTHHQLFLSWVKQIQLTYLYFSLTSWRSVLILSCHLCLTLQNTVFLSDFMTKILYAFSHLFCICYISHPSHPHFFDHPNNMCWRMLLWSSLSWNFLQHPGNFPIYVIIFSLALICQKPCLCSSFNISHHVLTPIHNNS